jgi:hypothetical protein
MSARTMGEARLLRLALPTTPELLSLSLTATRGDNPCNSAAAHGLCSFSTLMLSPNST